MNWSNHAGNGAAVSNGNSLEASVAYSAFIANGGEEVENVTFAQFLSEYWTALPAPSGEGL